MRMKLNKYLSVAATIITLAAGGSTLAQSTDRSNPTPFPGAELLINGPKPTNEQYFYGFKAGPGQVSITVAVKASSSSTFVGFKVYDGSLNQILSHNMNATLASPEVVKKTFVVSNSQQMILAFTSDPNLSESRIALTGAVSATGGNGSKFASGGQGESPASTQSLSSSSLAGSKSFTIRILDAVGQKFAIPTNGMLRIEMKDGSVQEIDMALVKMIRVKK